MFPANRERTFCFPWVNHGPFALHPHLCKSTCTPIVNVLSDFRRILSNVGGWSYLQKHLLSRQLLAGWFLPFFLRSCSSDSGSTAIRPLTKLRPMWTSNERTTPKTIDEAKTGAVSRSYGDVQTYRSVQWGCFKGFLFGRSQGKALRNFQHRIGVQPLSRKSPLVFGRLLCCESG